jgi:hypothetical protein
MDQEITKLMQFEMEQANSTAYTNDAQSFDSLNGSTPAPPAVSSDMQGGYSQNQISQSRSYEYSQALAKAQSQDMMNNSGGSSAFSTPRQSMSGDNAFQSPLASQVQGYGRIATQQQQLQQQNTPNRVMSMQNLQQMGNQFYQTSSMTPPISQGFPLQSNVGEMSGHGVPRNMMEGQQQMGNFPMQQQQPPYTQQSGSTRSQQRPATLQEFSAQIDHLDKRVLIELLWNQRNALAYWQRRSNQLDLQLSAQQNVASNMRNSGYQSSYNSPMGFVSPSVAADAEMQRAHERNAARSMQQQQMPSYPFVQPSSDGSAGSSQGGGNYACWGENAQLYWEKIRVMRAAYAEQLRIAKRALAHHTAPPNSSYSVKAQSVMDNIGLVINILEEQPTHVQPRKFDVLTSIERFIQITVVPIVRKVQSSFTSAASQAAPSAPYQGVATNVSTHAPGVPPAHDGSTGQVAAQSGDHQYGGSEWAASNSVFNRIDNSRQSSHGAFADPVNAFRGNDEENARVMDGLTPPVENDPASGTDAAYGSSEYAPVRPESESLQAVESTPGYEVATTAPKEPSTGDASKSESRPSATTDMRSSDECSSPSGIARDSSAKMQQQQGSSVDDLNDFTDFPELDFETMQENSSYVKENNPSNTSRKRGIEDV